jgi:hypothetical protein
MLNQTRALWGIARESPLQGPGISDHSNLVPAIYFRPFVLDLKGNACTCAIADIDHSGHDASVLGSAKIEAEQNAKIAII